MKHSCKYCGGIHPEGFTCSQAPKRKYKSRYDDAARFRNSGAWRDKREEIKERDKYLCQYCLSQKVLNYALLEVHHIVPLIDDYSKRLDNDNLITLCSHHHKLAEKNEIKASELLKLLPPTL